MEPAHGIASIERQERVRERMTRMEIFIYSKPIFFNTEMVRAILDGKKTVTRLVMKPQPIFLNGFWWHGAERWPKKIRTIHLINGSRLYKMPYKLGDYLYVRETWKTATIDPAGGGYALRDIYLYKADEPIDTTGMLAEERWHPSIYMPKEAARIFLRVKDIKVERLQDITEEGAKAEGISEDWACGWWRPSYYDPDSGGYPKYRETFAHDFWDYTIKPKDHDKYGWDANPWVWVIEFERVEVDG